MNTAFTNIKRLISRTGSFDLAYQAKRYSAAKNEIAKALATVIVLFSFVGLIDFIIMDDPASLLELRLLFSPTFLLLFALLYLSNSFILMHLSTMLTLGGSAVSYALYTLDGSTLMAMNSTIVVTLNLLVMMPFLRTPLWISFIPSLLMVVCLAVLTSDQQYSDWFFFGGTILGLFIVICFSEFAREIDEYELYQEENLIRQDQQKKLQWSFMTGRLLRHELSNQLIGLSSSLDMMQRDDKIEDKRLISDIEKQTSTLRNELNELALASEWSAKDEASGDESKLCKLVIRAFASNEIELKQETGSVDCNTEIKSKNLCLYALNRLARAIHDEFREFGVWGDVSCPGDDQIILRVVIRSFPTPYDKPLIDFSTSRLSSEPPGVSAAKVLLKTEAIELNIQVAEKEINIEFKRQT